MSSLQLVTTLLSFISLKGRFVNVFFTERACVCYTVRRCTGLFTKTTVVGHALPGYIGAYARPWAQSNPPVVRMSQIPEGMEDGERRGYSRCLPNEL